LTITASSVFLIEKVCEQRRVELPYYRGSSVMSMMTTGQRKKTEPLRDETGQLLGGT
jgi:hypothetical protein